ncbi:unnamed protein product [Strongylus vulgaris]|uniref:Uncharacterized protein n=1 Tax=Strongylus vulgaris TaxID=40348 RepID=A0A3P7KDH0_STRVU|nr:unnamed protein product [Strongylus vulgaris]
MQVFWTWQKHSIGCLIVLYGGRYEDDVPEEYIEWNKMNYHETATCRQQPAAQKCSSSLPSSRFGALSLALHHGDGRSNGPPITAMPLYADDEVAGR